MQNTCLESPNKPDALADSSGADLTSASPKYKSKQKIVSAMINLITLSFLRRKIEGISVKAERF